ncbi:hypothetical protein [Ktedonobacter racemifer]|nr:hypothetical protein [Ktedonobacter racemifer]
MMNQTLTCLVTLHGIGFQHPPQGQTPGYADRLHANLSKYLDATQLSTDPLQRPDTPPSSHGPIYVQSCWPAGSHCREAGLARLGVWVRDSPERINSSQAPLSNGKGSIVHIALVYSDIEENRGHLVPTLNASMMLLSSLFNYISPLGIAHFLKKVVPPLFSTPKAPPHASLLGTYPSLRTNKEQTGRFAILQQLQTDVAAYVSTNEQRERIRSFILDALLRLASRDDVGRIILNTHSNGTVIAFDVLRLLPQYARERIAGLITAGSPLRKYVTFFRWGRDIECDFPIKHWLNFWDDHDPVADPLAPPLSWRRETPVLTHGDHLFVHIDPYTGDDLTMDICDIQVDNLRFSSPGGLQAHNYWDNERQFILPLTKLLLTPLT